MYTFCIYITCSALPCSAPIGQAVHQLLLIQSFRPDRLLAMSHIFVSKVLGESFMSIIEQPLDLANIVDSEVVNQYSFNTFTLQRHLLLSVLLNLSLTFFYL